MSKDQFPPIGDNSSKFDEDDAPASAFGCEGWVAVGRAMRDHWLVGFGSSGKFNRSEAWLDLIMECRYADGSVNNNGRKMQLRPGQLLGATTWLATRWSWTAKEVRGFLDKLEQEGMITRTLPQTTTHTEGSWATLKKGLNKGRYANVLTVSKYSIYQLSRREQGQVEGPVAGRLRAGMGPVEGHIYKEETREQGNPATREETKESSQPVLSKTPPSGLAGLNGSAEPMIADVLRWMHNGTETSARKWLANTIHAFGQDITKDAWIKLNTELATGGTIAQPLPAWSKIAIRMRDDKKRAPASGGAATHEQAMRAINQISGSRK